MSATAVLAIVVAVGEAQDPASMALLDAARESLGTAAVIRLVETDDLSDARALGFERDLGARAVVVLNWKEPAHLHAVIRLHSARGKLWTTRFFTFGSRDTLLERGRTLGFAVASMTPQTPDDPTRPVQPSPSPAPSALSSPSRLAAPTPPPAPAAAPPGRPPSPPTPRVTQPPAGAISPTSLAALPKSFSPLPSTEVRPAPPSAPAAGPASVQPEDQESTTGERQHNAPTTKAADVEVGRPHPRPPPFGIGIAAVGSVGLGGPQSAVGGKVAIAWFPAPSLAIRGDVGLRVGPLPELPGSHRLGSLGLGLEWWPVTDRTQQAWGVGVRADALATANQVTGTILDGRSEAHYRFQPGADFVIQAFAGLNRPWQLIGGAVLEGVSGATDIRKGDDLVVVATIPAIRVVAEIGLRRRF